jgi:hypothetical protein
VEGAVSWFVALVALAGELDRARDEAVEDARALATVVHHAALDLACQRLIELAAAFVPAHPAPTTTPEREPAMQPAPRPAAPTSPQT